APIKPDNSGATNAAQGVLVRADDDNKVISVAGGIQYGGSAGVGAGVDVGVITKHTTAAVAQNANVKLLGNMRVNADSEENIISVSAMITASGGAGVSVSASIYPVSTTTTAHIDGTVNAGGVVSVLA